MLRARPAARCAPAAPRRAPIARRAAPCVALRLTRPASLAPHPWRGPWRGFSDRPDPPRPDEPPPPAPLPPSGRSWRHRLAASTASSYWRGARQRINWDTFAAAASWILFGTGAWLILGTTTAVGLVLFLMNVLEQQEYYAERLGRSLSSAAGYRITFAGRIYSSLWEGKIRLRDVTLENELPPGPGEARIALHVEELAVRLSLEHWLQGRGLLTALEAHGVTGRIDGNAGGPPPADRVWTPRRRTPLWGDFHFLNVEITDADVSIQPYGFSAPLELKLFFARASRLRRQYLLLDVLLADHVVGEINSALFVLRSSIPDPDEPTQRSRLLKATGLPIQLLQCGGASGPLAWLTRGRFDITARLSLAEGAAPPVKPDPFRYVDPASPAPAHDELASGTSVGEEELRVECNLLLSNLAASVPLATPHISYLAAIGVRPVAAYLNANYTQIPLRLAWTQPAAAYDGAWYPNEARLMESVSRAAGEELASLVTTHRERRRVRSLILLGLDGVKRGAVHAWHYATHYFWQLTPI